MFAVIERLPTGLFLWVTIGLAVGYVFALLGEKNLSAALIPMAAGLAGGLAFGLGLGLWLSGYRLWECTAASALGACLLAAGSHWLRRPRPV